MFIAILNTITSVFRDPDILLQKVLHFFVYQPLPLPRQWVTLLFVKTKSVSLETNSPLIVMIDLQPRKISGFVVQFLRGQLPIFIFNEWKFQCTFNIDILSFTSQHASIVILFYLDDSDVLVHEVGECLNDDIIDLLIFLVLQYLLKFGKGKVDVVADESVVLVLIFELLLVSIVVILRIEFYVLIGLDLDLDIGQEVKKQPSF